MKVTVAGPSREVMMSQAEVMAKRIEAKLSRLVNTAVAGLGQVTVAAGMEAAVSLNDLNGIRTGWEQYATGTLTEALLDLILSTSSAQVGRTENAVLRATGRQLPPTDPLDDRTVAREYMKTATNRLVGIGDELWTNARTELTAGMEAGESIPKLANRVRQAVDVTMPRATTIARTEVIGAMNFASLETTKALGYPFTKEWLSDPDERTRPTHEEADGQEVPGDQEFTVGGFPLAFPGDPSGPPQEVINCRCAITFEIEDDFEEDEEDDYGDFFSSSNTLTYGDTLPIYGTERFTVSWHLEKTEGGKWAVVHESGRVESETPTRKLAVSFMEFLKSKPVVMAADMPDDDDEDGCPDGHHRDESGECVPDMDDDEDYSGEVKVSGIAVVEGKWTGDGRQFALGALQWPGEGETPVALQWQKETSHGGMNDVTVNIGWLDSLERVGEKITTTGVIDADSPDGAEAIRFLKKRKRFGVSIVADDPEQADMEFVYPEGCDESSEGDEASEDMKCFMPKGVIFHSGRIRALTLVDVPAFVDAYIELSDADSVTASAITMGAVAAHKTATVDGEWSAATQEKKLDAPMSEATARDMYAWIDYDAIEDGEVAKSACKFPHHEVNADGTPGAANLTACSAGIGALNGARSTPDIPRGDMQGVYDHLAAHIRDADEEPPPPSFAIVDALEPLIAASHVIHIPDTPPAEWFSEPTELPEVGAITVTDDGRIFGLLAPAGVAHRSFRERVTVPKGVDYSRWMNRQTITEDGTRVTTGPITMACGHASTSGVGAESATDHYDNSCSIVATVRIGENRHGTWVAGALLPDVNPYQVARMLACQLSGDWRPHREEPGKREFCGALLVPVPGFPRAAAASVRMSAGELVASSAPVYWESADNTYLPVLNLGTETETETPVAAQEQVDPAAIVADLPDPSELPEVEEVVEEAVLEEETAETAAETEPEPTEVVVEGLPSMEELEESSKNIAEIDALAELLGLKI